MRVALLVPMYSIFSFLSIVFPQAKVYLLPWLDVFQANSMAAFFLLVCDYVSPNTRQRDLFFAAMTIPDRKKDGTLGEEGLTWYRVRNQLSTASINEYRGSPKSPETLGAHFPVSSTITFDSSRD